MKRKIVLCLLAGWAARGGAETNRPAADGQPYQRAARAYADFMLEKGRARWGKKPSPLFASMMNRATGDLFHFTEVEPAERVGVVRMKLAWGEHAAWYLPGDCWLAPSPNGRIHELWSPWPHFDRCYEMGPEVAAAIRRFALGEWKYQILDHERAHWNRHAYFNGSPDGQEMAVFRVNME